MFDSIVRLWDLDRACVFTLSGVLHGFNCLFMVLTLCLSVYFSGSFDSTVRDMDQGTCIHTVWCSCSVWF